MDLSFILCTCFPVYDELVDRSRSTGTKVLAASRSSLRRVPVDLVCKLDYFEKYEAIAPSLV